ncbi:hypothetical protein Y1Q_0006831 [Alligator mississippiensis]|uniref:Uncharacterized protein n=1 Tax=Alligator mississippiensis TaxID=8496 RepID=A0A151M5S3_ALLMI|nr:hypothetical protein Y1Q_0006831 [Alligator mississippiensis]
MTITVAVDKITWIDELEEKVMLEAWSFLKGTHNARGTIALERQLECIDSLGGRIELRLDLFQLPSPLARRREERQREKKRREEDADAMCFRMF